MSNELVLPCRISEVSLGNYTIGEMGVAIENNKLVLPCPVGQVSDGYHTFDELYDHRCLLFIALATTPSNAGHAWKSLKHSDGSEWEGWFIAGLNLRNDTTITYHLPIKYWDLCFALETLDNAPEWDGHTSQDVLERLKSDVMGCKNKAL